jgi:hypothetical protein
LEKKIPKELKEIIADCGIESDEHSEKRVAFQRNFLTSYEFDFGTRSVLLFRQKARYPF